MCWREKIVRVEWEEWGKAGGQNESGDGGGVDESKKVGHDFII